VLLGWGVNTVERYKAPRELVRHLPADHLYREVCVGSWDYFQPSMVFYCRREVERPDKDYEVQMFLERPLACYLFVPARAWEGLRKRMPGRVVARHYDLYTGTEIVLVTNEPDGARAQRSPGVRE
jgi:hypothetical protein